MTIKTAKFDAADYLQTDKDIESYLEAALEENDPAFFQKALGTVARARGMQTIATRSKATRAGLYKALSTNGNPEFATIYRVIKALGYRFAIANDRGTKVRAAASVRRAPGKSATKKVAAHR
jgi:probable addiction module antidote protein